MRPAALARLLGYILIPLSLATALACGGSGNSGPNTSQRATGLAQTAAAVLTGTAQASITPQTPTSPPSATLPPPTQSATATQAPATVAPIVTASATACPNNDSAFVSDVDMPDGSHVAAGATFKKTWRLRNSGACVWTMAYTLRYISGEAMGGGAVGLPNGVPPGATVDITVSMVAPSSPGTYVSHWQMFTPAGDAFGTKPYVEIKVP